MLEKYKDEQPVLYGLLSNSIKYEKLSHAYLFETNNNPNSLDIIYSFVKEILCPRNTTCDKCNICSRIDNGNYLDLKIINPDGMQIKKEQMSELQDEFSKVTIEGNKKIYIINECDKMNAQASNSILKFLEEPVDNIIAILVTNDINKVLKTIISRCQVVSLTNTVNVESIYIYLAYLLIKDNVDNVIKFLNFYEDNKKDTIAYIKEYWHDKFKERQDNILAIDIMINFYYDVLKYKINGQVVAFVNEIELIKKISLADIGDILYRLELLIEIKKLIGNNLNINLLIDYMIIKLGRR